MSNTLKVDPSFFNDPYAEYSRLRNRSPVVWDPALNRWLVFSYQDIRSALKRPELFSSRRSELVIPTELRERFSAIIQHIGLWFVSFDGAKHSRIRAILEPRLGPPGIRKALPIIENIGSSLLKQMLDNGNGDFVADYAFLLPAKVVCALLGVEPEHWPLLKQWAEAITSVAGSSASTVEDCERASNALSDTKEYFRDIISYKINHPGDDILTDLVHAFHDHDRESVEEMIIAQAVLLFWAGHETTQNLIANSFMALKSNPSQLAELQSNTSLVTDAIEEFLRYDAPVQALTRVCIQDTILGNQRISAGEGLMLFIGSANRDPTEFLSPELLLLKRRPTKHLAFGHGSHYCLGAGFARAEAAYTLRLFAPYLSDLNIDLEQCRRKQNLVHRGFESMPFEMTVRQNAGGL